MTDLLQFLLDMRNGKVATDCNQKFNDVLDAVIDTGGKGELNIKLKIEPSKFAIGGIVVEVEAEHEIKSKIPELKIGKATFFVNKEKQLTRNDPGQESMFGAQEVVPRG